MYPFQRDCNTQQLLLWTIETKNTVRYEGLNTGYNYMSLDFKKDEFGRLQLHR